jgi:hypothetical protein
MDDFAVRGGEVARLRARRATAYVLLIHDPDSLTHTAK